MTNFFTNTFYSDPLSSIDWDDHSWTFKSITENSQFPFCNIWVDEKENLQFEFSLAGYDKKGLEVSLDTGVLVISHSGVETNKDIKYIQKGIKKSSFEKAYKLSESYINSEPKASFENGILKITIPKDDTKRKKAITIN